MLYPLSYEGGGPACLWTEIAGRVAAAESTCIKTGSFAVTGPSGVCFDVLSAHPAQPLPLRVYGLGHEG